MASNNVNWSDIAQQLLRKRDRYTDDLIRQEFRPVETEAVRIGQCRYVTPVADNRYVVVWDRTPSSTVASVRAVVPTQLRSRNADDVRRQVGDVLRYESKGQFTLDLV